MTDKQKYLLNQMYNTISDLAEECEQDDKFHEVMIENNDLFPLSLDDWSYEWLNIVEREEEKEH